ncbi:helix-turn-helix domain-containing protein [Rhodococcoides corynebacterioides]|uniref:helix-turn-helix domain-containing protein n=1 Tax=Rhodococcoides corynebacterioides TaxID=53972 RepID=UPI00082E8633|nr:helix-turn-helix domain-containing protein [Rhodococcus corynebacterioides]
MTARPAGAYVHGIDGPVVLVPARVAAWIEANTSIEALRVAARGTDTEVDAVLLALHEAALRSRSSGSERKHLTCDASADAEIRLQTPTTHGDLVELLSTPETATVTGLSDRAIRYAITSGQLSGIRRGAKWFVRRSDAERFRNERLEL